MTAASVPPQRLLGAGRVAAALAVVSAAIHLALLDSAAPGSLAMVAMAGACLPCAWHLWRSPSATTWGTTAALDVTMLVLHVPVLAGASGHHHAAAAAGALGWFGVAVVVGQLGLSVVAALHLRSSVARPRRDLGTGSSVQV